MQVISNINNLMKIDLKVPFLFSFLSFHRMINNLEFFEEFASVIAF